MSRFHFSRAFRAATGISPWRYVTERRMARARELLIGGDLAMVEIASAGADRRRNGTVASRSGPR